MFAAGLKAGLITGVILLALLALQFVFSLISLDLGNLFACLVFLAAVVFWFVGGIMAARFAGRSAPGAGVLAGLVSSAIYGLANMVLVALGFAAVAQQAEVFLDPETLAILRDAGISPDTAVFATGLVFVFFLCCIVVPVIAAILGAIGGLFGPRQAQQATSPS